LNKNDIPYQSGISKGKVIEVLQTSQYTYLFVEEGNTEKWLALPKMQANPGDVYYYKNGYEMVNFKSTELGRTFVSVIFLKSVGLSANDIKNGTILSGEEPVKAEIRRYEISVPKANGGIQIGELYEKKESYMGKKVIIRGMVVHYNPDIMNKNWIHLQDGTSFGNKYDFTITSDMETKVGDTITVEGKLELNKDFGAGYLYEAILVDAAILDPMKD
jgi:hypothetical protein